MLPTATGTGTGTGAGADTARLQLLLAPAVLRSAPAVAPCVFSHSALPRSPVCDAFLIFLWSLRFFFISGTRHHSYVSRSAQPIPGPAQGLYEVIDRDESQSWRQFVLGAITAPSNSNSFPADTFFFCCRLSLDFGTTHVTSKLPSGRVTPHDCTKF